MDAAASEAAEQARRIRALPVDQVIGDVVFTLLQAAQIKLGRRDARLLIDVSTVAHEHARPYLPGDLTRQIDEALGELRLAQVGAEGRARTSGKQEHNDLDHVPAPPPTGAARPPAGHASDTPPVPGP
jgi:hypothetical protein